MNQRSARWVKRSIVLFALLLGPAPMVQAQTQMGVWDFYVGGSFYLVFGGGNFSASYGYTKYLGHSYHGVMSGQIIDATHMKGDWYEIDDNQALADGGSVRISMDASTGALTVDMTSAKGGSISWELEYRNSGGDSAYQTFQKQFSDVTDAINEWYRQQ